MADEQRIDQLPVETSPSGSSLIPIVINPTTTPETKVMTLESLVSFAPSRVADGRLTLQSGVPCPITDQIAKTVLHYTPYVGNQIDLYDGTNWITHTFPELSMNMSSLALSANTNYDIFVYKIGSSLSMIYLAWLSNTSRNALGVQDGVYVRLGTPTQRYVGTIRTTGTTGQCEQSLLKQYVWNYYNRVNLNLRYEDGVSHTYNLSTPRPWANAASGAKFEFVIGVYEEPMYVSQRADMTPGDSVGLPVANLFLDGSAVSGMGALVKGGTIRITSGDSAPLVVSAGYHYCSLYETNYSSSTASTFTVGRINGLLRG